MQITTAKKKEKKKKENTTAQIGTNVTARRFNAGLLARSQFALHIALHASHAAFPMVTLKISPYINVTLGWITMFMGEMNEGALHREERK
jgi:hypothetical protein